MNEYKKKNYATVTDRLKPNFWYKVAEFRLCVGHDCLGTHLHRTGIHPDPYCMLCSLHETMDRNHL